MEGKLEVAGKVIRYREKWVRGLEVRFYRYSSLDGSMSAFDHGELGQLADEEVDRQVVPTPSPESCWVRIRKKTPAGVPDYDPAIT